MSCKNLLKAFVLCATLLLSYVSFSQDRVVSGKVTDSKDGSGLPGVSVSPKGGTTGTQTGADGTYRISVNSSVTTLVFTSVGFTTQEVNVAGKTSVDVSLVNATTSLGEVVIIGYGTAKKKDLTGSVSVITAKDFN